MHYKLNTRQLENYAKVLVHFALGGGKGLSPGETVYLVGNESAKDLYMQVYSEIIRSGGRVIQNYLPDEFNRVGVNYELAQYGTDDQLTFFPEKYYRGLMDSIDHHLVIISTANPHALAGTPPENATKIASAFSNFLMMRSEKELLGGLTWTMCLFGTEAAAKEAGTTEEEYWKQIIYACHLDDEDPVASWRKLQQEMEAVKAKLDALKIEQLRIQSEGTDLYVEIGSNRKWLGGTGRNIPSFEVFTTPRWQGTNGYVSFDQPLYYQGVRISGICLTFEDGRVVKAEASENQEALKAMLLEENANKLGEFSMTDSRHSRVYRPMATTLYDENMGGTFGNFHVAVGKCFKDAYVGNTEGLTDKDWHEKLGFNKCTAVHTDMISTLDRTITAIWADGREEVIYKDGKFTFLE